MIAIVTRYNMCYNQKEGEREWILRTELSTSEKN